MQFDDAPHEGEPDAEPAFGAVERALALDEGLEDLLQHRGQTGRCRCRSPAGSPSPPPNPSDRVMRPPRGVYFAALVSRFTTTWVSRVVSPDNGTGWSGRSTSSTWP